MIKMSWRDIVRKSPPLTDEDEQEIKDLMRFRNMTREEAEKSHRRKTGKLGAKSKPSYDDYMRNRKSEKPDYIDLDGDGNKKESMKQAAKDKKKKPKPKNPFTRND
mgnify:FL=1|tara:strand:- start:326 stop:643 length:318 start_codon:yes stop_codon:yes gene_type:complete